MIDLIREQLALYLADGGDPSLVEQELHDLQAKTTEHKAEQHKGKLDARNALNDLTGAEWVYFLKSVETTAYSTKGAEGFAHTIRRIHPSPKPPQLMEKLIRFFTKGEGWVLDPFVGVGGTLLGCSLSGRNGVGIDLEQKYLDAYSQVCDKLKISRQHTICGDSRRVVELLNNCADIPEQFDLILTDPPYSDMLSRTRTGEQKKKTGKLEATPFTHCEHDLGNLPRSEFLADLRSIIEASVCNLKPKGHCVIFCKDLQPTPEHHNMLHADVVETLLEIDHLQFKGYKIWHDQTPKLYPFGYPFAFVSNQLHQYILIFRKESGLKTSKARLSASSDVRRNDTNE